MQPEGISVMQGGLTIAAQLRHSSTSAFANVLIVACCSIACLADAVAEPVRIGLTRSAGAGPMYIAVGEGYFVAEGLEPKLAFLANDALVADAVASGKVDFAVTELNAEYFALAARRNLKMIMSGEADHPGYPGDALIVTRKAYEQGLRDWKNLVGRRIGIPGPGSGSRYALARMFKRDGLQSEKITLVSLRTPEMQVGALMRGQVDAAIVPAATAQRVATQGNGKVLRWIGDEAPWQKRVVVTRSETIQSKRAFVERFVKAYQRGSSEYDVTFLQRDDGSDVIAGPRFDQYLGLIAQYTRLPPATLQRQLSWADRLLRIDVGDVERQLEFWQRLGLVDRSISAKDLLDLSFMPAHIVTER